MACPVADRERAKARRTLRDRHPSSPTWRLPVLAGFSASGTVAGLSWLGQAVPPSWALLLAVAAFPAGAVGAGLVRRLAAKAPEPPFAPTLADLDHEPAAAGPAPAADDLVPLAEAARLAYAETRLADRAGLPPTDSPERDRLDLHARLIWWHALDRSIDLHARRPPSRVLERLPRASGDSDGEPDLYARKGAADDPDPLAACEGWTGYAIARADLRRHIAALLRQS